MRSEYRAHQRTGSHIFVAAALFLSVSIMAQAQPSAISVTPSSGTGWTQAFAATYGDAGGYTNLTDLQFLVQTSVNGYNACYLRYNVQADRFYLADDGASWLPAVRPGTNDSAQNSQCILNGSASSASGSGTNITATFGLTFKAAFAGAKSTFMYTSDSSSVTGWQTRGSWTVGNPPPPPSPGVTSISPSSGTGLSQIFTAIYTDPVSYTNLTDAQFLVQTTVNGYSACYLRYNIAANAFYLSNDAAVWQAPVTAGTYSENSQCVLSGSDSSATGSGTTLTVHFAIGFKTPFAGQKNTYAYTSNASAVSGWQQPAGSSWNIQALAQPPASLTVQPSAGSATANTFTPFAFSVSSVNGFKYLEVMQMLFNWTIDGSNTCYIQYIRSANVIYVINDAGTAWLGGYAPGTTGAFIENSQCKIDVGATAVTTALNTLTVHPSILFKPSYPGPQSTFLYMTDQGGEASGWQQIGSWTGSPALTQPPTDPPNQTSGTGMSHTFIFHANDVNGYKYIPQQQLLISTNFGDAHSSCSLLFYPSWNSLYLADDANGSWGTPVAPGTPGGTLSNSQCRIDVANSNMNGSSGNDWYFTVPITFFPAFGGAKYVSMYSVDHAFNSLGWQQVGTWTVGNAPPPPIAVTVTSVPIGRQQTVDGVSCTTPCTYQWTPQSSHTIAAVSPQAGTSGTQYSFASWSDGGALSHSITTPPSATTYTANYTTQYLLTTTATTGGTIAPATGWYNAGTNVTVTASANTGYNFTGFSGALSGTTNPQTLTMNNLANVTANFSLIASNAISGSGPNFGNIPSTTVRAFPNVGPPSGSSPSFSPQANVVITAANINSNPSIPVAVVQNNVAIFNVSVVTIPAGVTVEVSDFDYVVFNAAGAISVNGMLMSHGPRVAFVGTGNHTVTGSLQATGQPGGPGGSGSAVTINGFYVPSGAGGSGGYGGNGGSASTGTSGFNGQGGAGWGAPGGGGWPGGSMGADGNGPQNSPGQPVWTSGNVNCPHSGGTAGGSNGTKGASGGGRFANGYYAAAASFNSAFFGLTPQPSGGGSDASGGCGYYFYYSGTTSISDAGTGGGGAGGGGGGGTFVFSTTGTLTVNGSINVNGGNGGNGGAAGPGTAGGDGGGGGAGGAGGTIILQATSVNVVGSLQANGGSGGVHGVGTLTQHQGAITYNGSDGGGGGGGRIAVISPNTVQGVSPTNGSDASGSTGGTPSVGVQHVSVCTPSIGGIQVNGQVTNTIIAGTTGYMSIYGGCLASASSVQVDGAGIQVTSLQYTADGQVNAFFQASNTATGGIHNVTVTTVNGTSSPSSSAQVFSTSLSVTEVSYTGPNLALQVDFPSPTDPPTWITVTNPVWKSTNAPSDNGPVAYVRGSTMTATVKFSISPTPTSPVTGVRIEGAITGLGKFVAAGATIPAASEVTISGLTADTPLPSATKYYNPMMINWSVSANGNPCTTNCATAGSSANKVYVTLGTPLFPVVLTPLHLAVSNDGATTPADAFQKTWAQFAGPANITAWDGRKLYYYRPGYGFDVCASDPITLLDSSTGSGQCGSFAHLLRWSLGMNGIPSDFVTVSVLDGDKMLVKDWTFTAGDASSYPTEPLYQWQIVLNAGDYMVPPQPTAPQYGDLRNLDTLPGQNTRPPSEKVFDRHFIVKVDPSLWPGFGPYFDASYGVWYSSSADFETKAIDGYLRAFAGDAPGVYRARRPGGGVNIGLVP